MEVISHGCTITSLLNVFFPTFQCLTAVHFSSTSLVSLSLDGCRAITSLELKCPYLEKVSLDGCDHLERAEFYPVSVTSCSSFVPILIADS